MYENLHKERSFSFYLWETVKLGGKIEYEGLKIRKNFGGRDLKWEKLYDKKQNYISLLEKHRLRKRLVSFFCNRYHRSDHHNFNLQENRISIGIQRRQNTYAERKAKISRRMDMHCESPL